MGGQQAAKCSNYGCPVDSRYSAGSRPSEPKDYEQPLDWWRGLLERHDAVLPVEVEAGAALIPLAADQLGYCAGNGRPYSKLARVLVPRSKGN